MKTASKYKSVKDQRTGATAMAWLAMIIGGGVSIAANVGHIFFVTHPRPFAALLVAMTWAALWPVALMVATEVIARVRWPSSVWWKFARFGGVGSVAVVAAVVSYQHMHGLLRYLGESILTAVIGPLGIDGLLVVGGFALMAIGESKKDTMVFAPSTSAATSDQESPPPPIAVETSTPAPVPVEFEPEMDAVETGSVAVATNDVPDEVLANAQYKLEHHQRLTGEILTAEQLAARIHVEPDMAARALQHLTTPVTRVNGSAAVSQ